MKIILTSVLSVVSKILLACTIISGITPEGNVLVGNNEDHRPTMNIYFKVVSASKATYGFWGTTYQSPEGWLQGGSNDQGLFFDSNQLPYVPLRKTAGTKPYTFNVDPGTYILQHCKDVNEVIDFFNEYHLDLPGGQVHLADKSGNLAIINNDTIIVTKQNFQVTTNFHPISKVGEYPSWRYDNACKILSDEGVSYKSIEEAIFSTIQKQNTMTIYSNIGNLTTGDWVFYAFGNKKGAFKFNTYELLKKGDKSVPLRDFMPNNPNFEFYNLSLKLPFSKLSAAWKAKSKNLSASERMEIPKTLIWNALFWDTNFKMADFWLPRWWENVKKKNANDYMLKGMVQLTQHQLKSADECFEEVLKMDKSNDLAEHYLAYIHDDFNTKGNIKFHLDGFPNAKIVAVGGISFDPMYYLMEKTQTGWDLTLDIKDNTVAYFFIVDGKKVFDKNNPKKRMIPTLLGPIEMNLMSVER